MPEGRAGKVIKIDEEGKAYMPHAEKICRKIKNMQNPLRTRGFHKNTASASLLFSVTIPSRKDQELREP